MTKKLILLILINFFIYVQKKKVEVEVGVGGKGIIRIKKYILFLLYYFKLSKIEIFYFI